MRENRPYGLEGGKTGSTGLPYPYANSLTHNRAEYRSRKATRLFMHCGIGHANPH